MTLLYVTSAQPGQGRTGVAAALARHFAYAGRPTRLVRLEEPASNAAADAAWYATLEFALGSPSSPQSSLPAAGAEELLVAEGPAEAAPADAAVVFVQRRSAPTSFPGGTVACVVTAVPGLRGPCRKDGSPTLVELGEDRTLAGFALDEALALLHGELIVPGDVPPDVTSDHLVIAPIGSDAGQPYFRRFPSMMVVARFDRTDMHLAALRAGPNAVILTGGRQPSGYTIDAASASGVPVVLSRTDTENTVIALERVFERTRFRGERKLERMAELLEQVDIPSLVSVPAATAS